MVKFNGKGLHFYGKGYSYIELQQLGEVYLGQKPTFFACNLVFGKPYMDVGGTSEINCEQTGCKNILNFHRRGWNKSSHFKVTGSVLDANGEEKVQIEAKWSESIKLIYKGREEVVWQKRAYPPKWEEQYGLTHFAVNMNYFPKRLHNVVAPTDTRRRGDQRGLEEGDHPRANSEKDRLEDKQRATRKYKETRGIEHTPAYFTEDMDHEGNKKYNFNGLYWEDRKA
jgi:hypothetical protein